MQRITRLRHEYVYEINCTLGFIFVDPRKQTIQRISDSKAKRVDLANVLNSLAFLISVHQKVNLILLISFLVLGLNTRIGSLDNRLFDQNLP